ncbi:MAG: ATP-binding cassette domain-containing protein [Syntrophaceae bacterium]|nr:ATP-binding cassette domain-containing protein [Syntrophaceae bacterium]
MINRCSAGVNTKTRDRTRSVPGTAAGKGKITMDPNILLKLEGITVRLGTTFLLHDTTWEIRRGEHWAILGPNGAGKSTLARVLAGEELHVRGRVIHNGNRSGGSHPGHVSLELQECILAREETKDAARAFAGSWNDLERVRDTVGGNAGGGMDDPAKVDRLLGRLGIADLGKRPIRFLSTGEFRKVLIARALLVNPEILILDEPFAGLDRASRSAFREIVRTVMNAGTQVVVITHRRDEIPAEITHVLGVREGRVLFQGPRDEMLTPDRIRVLFDPPVADRPSALQAERTTPASGDILIAMRDVVVRYGDATILDGFSWTVRRGERWAIVGPNGSGKTTLLNLITADHPQAYSNDIRIFGRRRGSGESIWEIKARIGFVSSEFQIRYRLPLAARDVILSGFFDSVGLYRHVTASQVRAADDWAARLDIAALAGRPFDSLSFGERRMVLLARAMVKSPELLVLDEPCQGLDTGNRSRILEMVNRIAETGETTILFVTHHPDELPACIDQTLSLAAPAERTS